MRLPVPKLVTFYNGATDIGDRVLRLSDSFPMAQNAEAADVEVCVKMINIRPQYGSDHLKNCKPLSEYSWFVEEVRRNRETMELFREEGREEGSNLLAKLIRVLTPGSKDYEDALNGTYETRQELFKKYNIV